MRQNEEVNIQILQSWRDSIRLFSRWSDFVQLLRNTFFSTSVILWIGFFILLFILRTEYGYARLLLFLHLSSFRMLMLFRPSIEKKDATYDYKMLSRGIRYILIAFACIVFFYILGMHSKEACYWLAFIFYALPVYSLMLLFRFDAISPRFFQVTKKTLLFCLLNLPMLIIISTVMGLLLYGIYQFTSLLNIPLWFEGGSLILLFVAYWSFICVWYTKRTHDQLSYYV